MPKKSRSGIRFGDPRIFFESKTTKPFDDPSGIHYDTGAVIRGAAHIKINNQDASVSLPSMAELIYFQADRNLSKASSIKKRALKLEYTNGIYRIENEELFYAYVQLCSLGILGLYSALEGMVYELYIRKNNERPVMISGKTLAFDTFTNLGFERKITSIASQLSGKPNIYGTNLLVNAKQIKTLRSIIQHWDVERREDYFINLPENHPLKAYIKIEPSQISQNARSILDHYKLTS